MRQALAGCDRDDGGAHPVGGYAGLARDLVGEPHHRDAMRASGLDAGLDRRTDIVDVNVDVPQIVAGADNDERNHRVSASSARSDCDAPDRWRRAGTAPRRSYSVAAGLAGRLEDLRDRGVRRGGARVLAAPVTTPASASSSTTRPRPPASTTPARASQAVARWCGRVPCAAPASAALMTDRACARRRPCSRPSRPRPGRRSGSCPRPGRPLRA